MSRPAARGPASAVAFGAAILAVILERQAAGHAAAGAAGLATAFGTTFW